MYIQQTSLKWINKLVSTTVICESQHYRAKRTLARPVMTFGYIQVGSQKTYHQVRPDQIKMVSCCYNCNCGSKKSFFGYKDSKNDTILCEVKLKICYKRIFKLANLLYTLTTMSPYKKKTNTRQIIIN